MRMNECSGVPFIVSRCSFCKLPCMRMNESSGVPFIVSRCSFCKLPHIFSITCPCNVSWPWPGYGSTDCTFEAVLKFLITTYKVSVITFLQATTAPSITSAVLTPVYVDCNAINMFFFELTDESPAKATTCNSWSQTFDLCMAIFVLIV